MPGQHLTGIPPWCPMYIELPWPTSMSIKCRPNIPSFLFGFFASGKEGPEGFTWSSLRSSSEVSGSWPRVRGGFRLISRPREATTSSRLYLGTGNNCIVWSPLPHDNVSANRQVLWINSPHVYTLVQKTTLYTITNIQPFWLKLQPSDGYTITLYTDQQTISQVASSRPTEIQLPWSWEFIGMHACFLGFSYFLPFYLTYFLFARLRAYLLGPTSDAIAHLSAKTQLAGMRPWIV